MSDETMTTSARAAAASKPTKSTEQSRRVSDAGVWTGALGLLLLLVAPRLSHAQGALAAGAHVARAGDPPRRTTPTAQVARGIRMPSLVLAHRLELGLTNEQAKRLESMAMRLDLVVSPLEAEIDSLALSGNPVDWQRVSTEQGASLREQTRRRSALIAVVHDQLLQARVDALATLTPTQDRDAIALETAQLRAEADRYRSAVAGGGWNAVNSQPRSPH